MGAIWSLEDNTGEFAVWEDAEVIAEFILVGQGTSWATSDERAIVKTANFCE